MEKEEMKIVSGGQTDIGKVVGIQVKPTAFVAEVYEGL